MKLVDLYAVYQGDNEYGGGHPEWYFDNEELAQMISEGRGWYGGKAPVETVKGLPLGDGKYYIIPDATPVGLDNVNFPEYAKMNALAKLTAEDKKVLGL